MAERYGFGARGEGRWRLVEVAAGPAQRMAEQSRARATGAGASVKWLICDSILWTWVGTWEQPAAAAARARARETSSP